MKVVGSEGTVALGALPLPGVVTHLETFVAEHVETLGEHRLLVSCVAAGAAQLGLETDKYIVFGPNVSLPTLLLPRSTVGITVNIGGCNSENSWYPEGTMWSLSSLSGSYTWMKNWHFQPIKLITKCVVFCIMTYYIFTNSVCNRPLQIVPESCWCFYYSLTANRIWLKS